MNIKDYSKYLKENDPALWKIIGKDLENPTIVTNELIRHYQWILFMGDIDELDLWDQSNKYYKQTFVEMLYNNDDFRDEFLNYFLFVMKVAYDDKVQHWYREVTYSILVNNKRIFWFDYSAMYILIAANYSKLRDLIVYRFNCDSKIGISKQAFINLLDGICNQEFYDALKQRIKKERMNALKNIYLY